MNLPTMKRVLAGLLFTTAAAAQRSNVAIINSSHLPATTTTNLRGVEADNVNLFRFDIALQIQDTVINAQTPITGLTPPAAAGSGLPKAAKALRPTPDAINAYMSSQCPPATAPPGIALQIAQMEQKSCEGKAYTAAIAPVVAIDLVNATDEQACFKNIQQIYPASILTPQQQAALLARLIGIKNQTFCKTPASGVVNDIERRLTIAASLSGDQAAFQTSSDYIKWATGPDKKMFDDSVLSNTQTISTLQTMLASKDVTSIDSLEQYNLKWQQRVEASASASSWNLREPLTCTIQWFGKTSGQAVSLNWIDVSVDGSTLQSKVYFTNSCLPDLTVTTGLGISFVSNPTYAFEPSTDYSKNSPVTTQLVGTSTDARITPLYVGQMNYKLWQPNAYGLHLSGGLGIGSSAAGTTGDFFFGTAFSLAHRALFITPSVHLTQRQALQGSYKLGDAKADLVTIPTTTRWKVGFALTFTLPVVSTP